MFGWTIVRKEELRCHRINESRMQRMYECQRWFSGWRDLDILWRYINADGFYGGIRTAREMYAKERQTDEYGRLIHPS